MEWHEIGLILLAGLLAGFLAGLLGIGGGLVTVPALYYILKDSDFPVDRLMQIAVATSLAATIATTFIASWSHARKGAVDFKVLRMYVGGLLIGCICGAILGQILDSSLIKKIFGIMAISIGIYFLCFPSPRFFLSASPNPTLNFFGIAIGNLSSLLGIGGGVFSVPLLLGYGLTARQAVGISSMATLCTVWVGSAAYLMLAWREPAYPHTFGYIYLPALCLIAAGSVFTAYFGAKAAHFVSQPVLKRLFGTVSIFTGFSMVMI